jgi:hypothetical protein
MRILVYASQGFWRAPKRFEIGLRGQASAAVRGALTYAARHDLRRIRNTGAAPPTFDFTKWIVAGASR